MTRVALTCPHRPPCPGCPRFGATNLAPSARALLLPLCIRTGATLETTGSSEREGFRRRARLAVRGRAQSPKVGIFEAGTHRVVDIPHCRIHHPVINEVIAVLKRVLRQAGATPYSDTAHCGLVRYVQVTVERGRDQAQVVLVTNDETPDSAGPLLSVLETALGDSLHSLWWNGNPERTNAILGPHWQRFVGPEALRERVGGVSVFFPPGAFGQSHFSLAESMTIFVRSRVPDGARVVEYYAGTGAIGLGLIDRCEHVHFNEVSPAGIHGLTLGLAAQSELCRSRAHVHEGKAGEYAHLLTGADTVIVDPPRKGLDAALLTALQAHPVPRVIYVACGLPAFVRDAEELLEAGFSLERLHAFDLFTYTEHTEVVGVFTGPPGV